MNQIATGIADAPAPLLHVGSGRSWILIVDDDLELRQLLCVVLQRKGWQTTVAGNGSEALQSLEASVLPTLILLDLNMPVMDGWEFRERQLRDPRLAAVPVVVVSAHGLCDKTAGLAATVLRKPLDLIKLLAAVAPFQKPETEPSLR